MPLRKVVNVEHLKMGLSHNLPDKNWGGNLIPASQQAEFDKLLVENVDIAIYAHVHHQILRYSSKDQLILNPGSIGQAFNSWQGFQPEKCGYYAILSSI